MQQTQIRENSNTPPACHENAKNHKRKNKFDYNPGPLAE